MTTLTVYLRIDTRYMGELEDLTELTIEFKRERDWQHKHLQQLKPSKPHQRFLKLKNHQQRKFRGTR